MREVKIEIVEKLRKDTGAGVMNCLKALKDSNGDYTKAKQIIKKLDLAKAKKKSGQKTEQGIIESYVHQGKIGVLIELKCQTDFVARSDDFKELAHNLAMQIAALNPKDNNNLLKGLYIKDETINIEDLVKKVIAKIGENIKIKRFCRYEI